MSKFEMGIKAVNDRRDKAKMIKFLVQSYAEDCSADRSVTVINTTVYLPLKVSSRFTVATDSEGLPTSFQLLRSKSQNFFFGRRVFGTRFERMWSIALLEISAEAKRKAEFLVQRGMAEFIPLTLEEFCALPG